MIIFIAETGGSMNVAFISDIHSNPLALSAVLKDIASRNVEKIYNLGDSIGYHTKPNEVLEMLRQSSIESIKGNHDLDILNKKFNPEKNPDIFEWTWNELSEANCNYLASLPQEITTTIEGWKIKICHGSPESVELYCYENSTYSASTMENLTEDVLACGHTHLPYIKEYEGKFLINSGSVGKPKIGRPNASYNLVKFSSGSLTSEIIEVPYDFETMASHCEQLGFTKYASHLRTGIVS